MDNGNARQERRIRVVICDDFDMIRGLLRIVIESDPDLLLVGEARNAREVLAEARSSQPDVILLDLSMPGRTGLDVLPDILVAAPDTAVVAYTGLAEAIVGRAAHAAGATSFLEKGADPADIITTIKDAHRSRQRSRKVA